MLCARCCHPLPIQMMNDISFTHNLREEMAAMNMTSLFDGVFAKTASKLMAKTKLGGVVSLCGGGGVGTRSWYLSGW